MAAGTSQKPIAIYSAIAANFGIALTKFAAGAVSASSAMISEGVHSLVDTGNQMLLLLGLRQSCKPASEKHPFGHGKEQYFWSLIVAVLLFGAGGGMSIYQGITNILDPGMLEDPFWSYIVLAVAMVMEGATWIVAYREFKKRQKQKDTFWHALRTSKDPSIFTVLAEDTAAIAGLVVAFLGIYLGHQLGNVYLDGTASLIIGAILIIVAIFLIYESKGLLMGESADPEVVRHVRGIALGDPAVNKVHDLLTMHLGPEEVLLNMELEFAPQLSADQVSDAVDRLEAEMRRQEPSIQRIFIEAEALKTRQAEGGAGQERKPEAES
jgi:cation diffusion facilitator family transporter